ncbi:MAG: type II toxin-antitoxin system HicB family antitoxin [Dehalococcoidia bacterium]
MASRLYTFPIIIEKEPEDPGYFAHSPLLPGCFSAGQPSKKHAKTCARPFNSTWRMLIENGDPVPQGGETVTVEEMTLGIPA